LLVTKALPDLAAIRKHMEGHKAILAPKFVALHEVLEARLADTAFAEFRMPGGGYFYSVKLAGPFADAVVQVAKSLGVLLTSHLAGYADARACPNNRLRLAPSCVPLKDIPLVARVIAIAIERAALTA
jgi:DNA-binding transcriptional MocR family regulator